MGLQRKEAMRKATITIETTRFNATGDAVFTVICPMRGEMNIPINVLATGGSPVIVLSEHDEIREIDEAAPVGVEKVRRAMEENRIPDESWSIEDVRHFCIVNSIKHGEMTPMDDLLTLCKAWLAVPNKRPPNYNRGLQQGMRR